ncbi:MAG: hypothetical protein PHX08_01015 [Lachnospiraceae bacterium]|nr:hypothetical protein [Lachnospiraceae bacterium]
MANKLSIEFDGFKKMMERIDKMGGSIEKVTEEALTATHKHITPKAEAAIEKHHRTGKTEETLKKDSKVEWSGTTASIEVGFNISKGGMPSVFLMYGTKVKGSPRTPKDTNLYNSIYGTATRKEVAKIQEEIIGKALKEMG